MYIHSKKYKTMKINRKCSTNAALYMNLTRKILSKRIILPQDSS